MGVPDCSAGKSRWAAVPTALLLAVATVVALPPPAAQAAGNLWVGGNNCSDSGTGTKKTPYCTISAAAAVAVAGQSVRVEAGTYNEMVVPANSGLAGLPIEYRPDKIGDQVTITGGTYGFSLTGVSWVNVSGFRITGTTSNGVYVKDASNVAITGNRVERAGVRVEGLNAAGIYVDDSVDSTVSANLVVDNSASGIYLTGDTTRVLVKDNEATGNSFGWQRNANGIDVRASGNSIIGNRTHHNEDSGIQIYPGGDNSLVANNVSYANKGFTTTLLANCAHPANGDTTGCFTGDHGIDNLKVTGGRIIGNTVYGNTTSGINFEGLVAGTPSDTVFSNNVSADNAISCPNGAGGTTTCPGTGGNIRVDATSTTGTIADRDVLWTSTGGTVMAWGNLSYRTLAEVRAVSGQETTGRQADPMFVNAASGNFRLRGGSPAIDMADAAATGHQATDIEGQPRADDVSTPDAGTGPRSYDDAGAHEYPPVPGTPVASAVAGNRLVALSWTVPPAGGSPLTKFTVYRGTSPTTLTQRATFGTATTSFTDSTVTAWTRYYYQVSATNAHGESLRSTTVSAIPTGPPIAPAIPVVSATTAPHQVSLSWSAPAANGSALTGYTVYRGTSPAPTTPVATVGPAATGYIDTGRTNGVTYYYRVRAANAVGMSAFSADVAAMPTSITLAGIATRPLTAGGTSASLPLPTETAPGDLLIAWLGFTNATSAIEGMDGWTQLPWSPLIDGTLHTTAAYYKVAAAGEAPPTLTWTTTSKGTFAVAAYRGVDAADLVAANGGMICDLQASSTVSTPLVATPKAGTWAVALFASRSSTATQKNISWEPPPLLTERLDANNAAALSSPWVGVAIADSAGAVSVNSHSFTATPSFLEAHHNSALIFLNSVGGAP